MVGRIVIDEVSPTVGNADRPATAVVGEQVWVSASLWSDTDEVIAASVLWCGPGDGTPRRARMAALSAEDDRMGAALVPDRPGAWTFRVEAWTDPWATWTRTVRAKIARGQGAPELTDDFEAGARLLETVAYRPGRWAERELLLDAASALRAWHLLVRERVAEALSPAVHAVLTEHPVRRRLTRSGIRRLRVERGRAGFGAWYELFPRSTGETGDRAGDATGGAPAHDTFDTAIAALGRIAEMGFDVVCLPPVHPVGTVHRKGRDNSTWCRGDDVGSPWAVGSRHGGHDALHPELGTFADFDRFLAAARGLGLEVALDLALQCGPDHPWVRERPEFFARQPDGTVPAGAEPAWAHQEVHRLDFDRDPAGLRAEIRRVVDAWLSHGVRIFRAHQAHRVPPALWRWLIDTVRERHPDVVFLADARTTPTRQLGLARMGFSQVYTRFAELETKAELTAFGRELVDHADELRPNLFVNTAHVLPRALRSGNPAAFAARAALAATLGPTWSVYAGYELCEHAAQGEDYRDAERFQLRPRDFAAADRDGSSLAPWLTRLNEIRKAHPALAQLRTLRFHPVDNDALLAYSKVDSSGEDIVLCVVNLDAETVQEGVVRWDFAAIGLDPALRCTVFDEVTGELLDWGERTYVKLDPNRATAHIGSVIER